MSLLRTNIVSEEKLRQAQLNTLEIIAESIAKSFGPMGSNTLILRDAQQTKYSKDGFTLLKEMKFLGTIEEATRQDMEDMLRNVVKEFGDNTTSVAILSYLIFKSIVEDDERSAVVQPPYRKMQMFKKAAGLVMNRIEKAARSCTVDDIYNITYTATNGNEMLAQQMKVLYEHYGMDVFIDITTSNTEDFIVKELDGVTLEAGYMDPCFVNSKADNCSHVHNAAVYYFEDPIDTMEMGNFFDAIIGRNIIDPINKGEAPVPTVILCPKISRDYSSVIQQLVEWMYKNDTNNRPPLLVVTNIYDKSILSDIALLCGCKTIRKYIDPKNQEADIERGMAPDMATITAFCGSAEEVVSDLNHTKFVNPIKMVDGGSTYTGLIEFIESEIVRQRESGSQGTQEVALLKRRLNALKANSILLYVGGISPAERDSFKDLLEDAVLNCRSAAKYGWGYGANFEGLKAATDEINYQASFNNPDELESDSNIAYRYLLLIRKAYREVSEMLYSTVWSDEQSEIWVDKSLKEGMPLNLRTDKFDGKVITSIRSDIQALDVISRLLTIMFTCNQAMLQNPVVNTYED